MSHRGHGPKPAVARPGRRVTLHSRDCDAKDFGGSCLVAMPHSKWRQYYYDLMQKLLKRQEATSVSTPAKPEFAPVAWRGST